jgi:hypothetical protein
MGARKVSVLIMGMITLNASIIDDPTLSALIIGGLIMSGFIMDTCKLDIPKVDGLTLGVSTMNSNSHNRYAQSGYI